MVFRKHVLDTTLLHMFLEWCTGDFVVHHSKNKCYGFIFVVYSKMHHRSEPMKLRLSSQKRIKYFYLFLTIIAFSTLRICLPNTFHFIFLREWCAVCNWDEITAYTISKFVFFILSAIKKVTSHHRSYLMCTQLYCKFTTTSKQ